MVIVQGTFRVAPEDRDAFLAQSVAGMVSSREEQGCIEYVMAADPVEGDRVVLSERWASMADLEEHLRRAAERRGAASGTTAAVAAVTVLSREMAIYEVGAVRPLG
ncbi:MAG TPA: putative quinol monooxygenase [Acidimicrobiales bacterium]|nr:putative quinol monooxygenase [Acidimicrobiales bacterium]